MGFVESVVIREQWDVETRLAELSLGSSSRLLKVVSVAISAAANATPFHPANAAGTFAYQEGTYALRAEYVGDEWQLDRPDGVEAIRNDELKLKVVFANVDMACDDARLPKPRSRKGAGTERVCGGNLFGSLPEFVPQQAVGWATYYLMVDEKGAAELTRPVVQNGTFTSYVERICLSEETDMFEDPTPLENDDVIDDFDPPVIRK
jgi:hypothetical protein